MDWTYEIQTATLKNVISNREFGPSNVTSDGEFGSTFQVMQISRICKKKKNGDKLDKSISDRSMIINLIYIHIHLHENNIIA